MIGLTGAHRTGKTTLAKAWAKENDAEYVALPKVIEAMGLEPKDINTLGVRLKVQRKLVEACHDTFSNKRAMFISDRTPLDVAAYTLADGSMDMTLSQQQEMVSIVEDCIDITNSCFKMLALLQPGIPYVSEPGKPLFNVAYQEHIHSLIVGFLSDPRVEISWWHFPRIQLDHDERMDGLDFVYHDVSRMAVEGFSEISIH